MDNLKTVLATQSREELSTGQMLGLIALAGIAAFFVGSIPIIRYPFRLLMTFVHEFGHGIAAIITGGHFESFVINPDGSGLAYSAGGWRFIIIPAGYLGVAVFAAVLITLGRSHRWSRIALGSIGTMLILLTLCYGRPAAFSLQAIFSSILTILMGISFGTIFLWVALKSPDGAIIFFLHLIAIKAGLTAFEDIIGLLSFPSCSQMQVKTDACSMANLTFIPAEVWAVVWAVIAVILIGGAIWSTWLTNGDENVI